MIDCLVEICLHYGLFASQRLKVAKNSSSLHTAGLPSAVHHYGLTESYMDSMEELGDIIYDGI